MKLKSIGLLAGLAMTACISAVATAQDAADSTGVDACELHVFPTVEGQAQTTGWLSGLGVIGAVADAAANEDNNVSDAEYLRDALGPRFQVEAFRSIDVSASLNLPEGTEVI